MTNLPFVSTVLYASLALYARNFQQQSETARMLCSSLSRANRKKRIVVSRAPLGVSFCSAVRIVIMEFHALEKDMLFFVYYLACFAQPLVRAGRTPRTIHHKSSSKRWTVLYKLAVPELQLLKLLELWTVHEITINWLIWTTRRITGTDVAQITVISYLWLQYNGRLLWEFSVESTGYWQLQKCCRGTVTTGE